MDFITDLIHKGGPLMFPLIITAMVALALAATQAWQRRHARDANLALGLLFVVTGILGSLQGGVLILDAVAHASAEHKGVLMAAGWSVALVTTQTGLILAAALMVIDLILGLAGRPAPSSKLTHTLLTIGAGCGAGATLALVTVGTLLLEAIAHSGAGVEGATGLPSALSVGGGLACLGWLLGVAATVAGWRSRADPQEA